MSKNKPERMVSAGLHLNPRAREDLNMTVDVGHFAQLSLLTSARIQLDTGKRPVGSSEHVCSSHTRRGHVSGNPGFLVTRKRSNTDITILWGSDENSP